jgi:cytoskeletal protein CcmA (bactofilin family)
VWCEGHAVTIAPTARLEGEVFARDITVFGRVSGTLVASEVVDLRPDSTVEGRVVSPRFILMEGATFNGTAEPHQLEAAFRVARHRRLEPAGSVAPHESTGTPVRRQIAPRLSSL